MKIRAVTLGLDLAAPDVSATAFGVAAEFLRTARQAFSDAGIEVQTTRAAGPDLARTLERVGQDGFARWAAETERAAADAGIDYLSLGRLPVTAHTVVERQVADIVAAGETGFVSADLVGPGGPSVAMARACARAVKALATSTTGGFGNLRFAATANCPPNIPFLPAAFHAGGQPRFSLAVQAADVVVDAFSREGSTHAIEDRLVAGLEQAYAPLEAVTVRLADTFGYPFVGVDLSPAPFPSDEVSIGGAIEQAGVDAMGAPGTLFVASLITRAIRRTRLPRCGFSGLMLPILEDSVLARRAAEQPPSLHSLLLYSAVCGTGLDTVPVPGDISEAELAGIYLDVAALSVALDGKPLTARVLPVPDRQAGDPTEYTFEFFANSRVLPTSGRGATGLLARG